MTYWFQEGLDRKLLIKEFNNSAKASFVNGGVPALLKCSISKGYKSYKHTNSAFFFTGIRIVAYTNFTIRAGIKYVRTHYLDRKKNSKAICLTWMGHSRSTQ